MGSSLDQNLLFLGKVEPDNLAYLAGILFGLPDPNIGKIVQAIVEIARLRNSILA